MRSLVLATALALVCATQSASAADGARGARECPFGNEACEWSDSAHTEVVQRARGALQMGAWNEAAELWRSALVMDGRIAEHWSSFATALTRAGRHREAVAAYLRAIQLDASTMREGTWSIARGYALMGNHKQASRWMELALQGGLAGHERQWSDPLFDRYRSEVLVRRAREMSGPASVRGARRTGYSPRGVQL
ncbi:MAG: tetratricopeptide repeat protein [Gemmatimonadaceae bacterium]